MHLMWHVRRLYWRALQPTTLGSRCIVAMNGAVLLVRHTYERWWYLPGGGVRRGESFIAAAQREVLEETGLSVAELQLLHIYHNRGEGKSDHVALFVTHMFHGMPHVASPEIAAVDFFPTHELPADTSPATRRRLTEWQTGRYATVW